MIIKTFKRNQIYIALKDKELFSRIDFSVLDRTPTQYNYKQFKRNFGV